MTPVDAVRRHPLAGFLLLAYGFSWSCWLAARVDPPSSLPGTPGVLSQVLLTLGTFGPFVAGAVAAWVTGTGDAFLARLGRWRVAPRWYAAAVGLPVLAVTTAYALHLLGGGPGVDPSRSLPPASLAVVFVVVLLAGGGNEEPGWRGFALPRLQRALGPTRGTLALAVVWAGWHLPAFLDPRSTQSGLPPVAWAAGVVAVSVTLTWLFNGAGESVPVTALSHATFNVAGLWVVSALPPDAAAGFYTTGVLVYLAAAGVLLAVRPGLGVRDDPTRPDAVRAGHLRTD